VSLFSCHDSAAGTILILSARRIGQCWEATRAPVQSAVRMRRLPRYVAASVFLSSGCPQCDKSQGAWGTASPIKNCRLACPLYMTIKSAHDAYKALNESRADLTPFFLATVSHAKRFYDCRQGLAVWRRFISQRLFHFSGMKSQPASNSGRPKEFPQNADQASVQAIPLPPGFPTD